MRLHIHLPITRKDRERRVGRKEKGSPPPPQKKKKGGGGCLGISTNVVRETSGRAVSQTWHHYGYRDQCKWLSLRIGTSVATGASASGLDSVSIIRLQGAVQVVSLTSGTSMATGTSASGSL